MDPVEVPRVKGYPVLVLFAGSTDNTQAELVHVTPSMTPLVPHASAMKGFVRRRPVVGRPPTNVRSRLRCVGQLLGHLLVHFDHVEGTHARDDLFQSGRRERARLREDQNALAEGHQGGD